MITAAVLRNLIEGDDSNFQAAKQRTEAGLNSLKTQAQTATAGISNSFQQAGSSIGPAITAPINTAIQSITSIGSATQSSFNVANQAVQTFGAQTTTSMGQAANAAAQVPAAVGAIGASVTQMGAQVTGATQQAAQGLGGMTAATTTAATGLNTVGSSTQSVKAQLASLESTFKSNESAIVSLSTQMAANKTRIAELKDQMTTLTISGGKYTEVTNEQGRTTRVLSDQFVNLRNQSLQLGSAQGILLAKQGEYRASQGEIIQSTNKLTESGNFLVKMIATKTNMVATAGTAFMGYDRVLQTFLGSIGGVSLATSLLITAGGFLIQKMTHTKEKTEDLDKTIKQLIESDLVLIRIFEQMSVAAGVTNDKIQAQVEGFKALLSANVTQVIINIGDALGNVTKHATAAASAENLLKQSVAELDALSIKRADSEAKLNAQLALQKTLRDPREIQEGIGQILVLDSKVKLLAAQYGGLAQNQRIATDALKNENNERAAYQATLDKNLKVLDSLIESGRFTSAQLVNMARDAGEAAETLDFLATSLGSVERAARAFGGALDALKLSGPSVILTTLGMSKANESLKDAIAGTAKEIKDRYAQNAMTITQEAALKEATLAQLPAIKQVVDAVVKRRQEEAGLNGQIVKSTDIQKQYLAELSKSSDEMDKAKAAVLRMELATSSSIKKIKEVLDKNSPLITERAIAGSPESIDKAIDAFSERFMARIGFLKNDAVAEFDDMAKRVAESWEKTLGVGKATDKGGLFFDFGARIREQSPEIEDALSDIHRVIQKRLSEFSFAPKIDLGNLRSEATITAVIDHLRKAEGITDAIWKKMSLSQKQALDVDFRAAADIYISLLEKMNIKAAQFATDSQVSFEKAASVDLFKLLADNQRKTLTQMVADNQTFWAELAGKASSAFAKRESDLERHLRAMTEETRQGNLEVLKQYGDLSSGIDNQLKFVTDVVSGRFDQMSEQSIRANYEAARGILETWVKFHPELQGVLDQLPESMNRSINKMKELGLKGATETTQGIIDRFSKLETGLDQSMNKVIAVIAIGMGKAKDVATGKMADMVRSVHDVISTMPGDIGEQLRRGENEFTKWFRFIDASVKLIQLALGKQQTGIAGVLSDIIGSHQKATTAAQTSAQQQIASQQAVIAMLEQSGLAWDVWADGVVAANQRAGQAASGFNAAGSGGSAGGFGGLGGLLGGLQGIFSSGSDGSGHSIGGGLANVSGEAGADSGKSFASGFMGKAVAIAGGLATFFGTRGQGRLQGVMGGAMAGMQIGSIFGPWGAGIGAAAGAIFGGLFGTGKSKEQKEAEKAAAERAKLDLQQTGVNIVNSALDGFSKGFDFLSKLDEFTQVSRSQFRRFFKNFSLLMDYFIDLSKKWTVENLDRAKAAAEAINPVVDTMSALPDAFEGVRLHTEIAESQFAIYWRDADRLMDGWFKRAEDWSGKQAKKIGKISERLLPSLQLTSGIGDALKSIIGVKEPTDEEFNVIDRILEKMTTHLGALAEKFEKRYMKTLEYFSEKAKSGLSLWKDTVDVIRASVDVPQLKESDAENVVGGMELFFTKLVDRLGGFASDKLASVKMISETVVPIASGIKAWGEATAVIRDYTAIGASVWEDIVADWKRGLDLTSLMIADAKSWLEKGISFEAYAIDAKAHWLAGVQAYGETVTGIASALNASIGNLQGGVPTTSSSFGTQSLSQPVTLSPAATQAQGQSFSVSAPASGGLTVNVTINAQGSIYTQAQIKDVVIEAVVEGVNRGRLNANVLR